MLLLVGPLDGPKVIRRLSGRPFSWAYLGQRIEEFYRVKGEFQNQGTYIDTSCQFRRAAEDLRDPYLAQQFEIGRALDSLRWWITTISYRSCYVSKTFHRVCYLKIALDLVNDWEGGEPLVVVADQPVRRTVARNLRGNNRIEVRSVSPIGPSLLRNLSDAVDMLAHRAIFIAREAYRIFQSRRAIRRPYVPHESTTLLLSSVSFRNVQSGTEFHRSFFGDLADSLGQHGYHVTLVPRILDLISYKQVLAGLDSPSRPVMVPHRYLGYLELIWAAISTFKGPPLPRTLPLVSGMDVGDLIKAELHTHWISNGAAHALLMAAVVRRWAQLGSSIDRIIYVYENQPWERAICWEAKRSFPEAAVVGYQHARVERLLLNFHLAPGEVEIAPLPDRVVTVGKYTAGLMSCSGYKPGQLRVGGALQMQNLFDRRQQPGDSSGGTNGPIVLVAPSNGPEEAAELVHIAGRLFDEDDRIRIIVKCHPIMPYGQISKVAGERLPDHVSVSEEPITDLMLKSAVLIYSGASVCFQAMALELPVIHWRTRFDFDLDPLNSSPGVRLDSIGLDDLREKVRWVIDHREEYVAEHRGDWARLVDEVYSPLTEETYRSFVDVE